MDKVSLGPRMVLGAKPVLLVGANVDDKPNFMVAGAGGVANVEPPMITVALRPDRYTLRGIRQNMTFSVNIPSVDLVKETDFCGLESGSKVNKVEVCQFQVFYGKLNSAPLVEECPVNLECSVVHILNLGSHLLVIGKIEETHVSESCLTDGRPDNNKIMPFIFATEPTPLYQAFGEALGKPHSIGREIKVTE